MGDEAQSLDADTEENIETLDAYQGFDSTREEHFETTRYKTQRKTQRKT